MFADLKESGFDVLALHHAEAILVHDMPDAANEIESVLSHVTLPVEELVRGGGGEGQLTQRIRNELVDRGWVKHNFKVQKIVDGTERESTSHEIDHVKKFDEGLIALEIEWNNKDPFFDRDLENFKRLHADGAISVGVIITRGESLQNSLSEVLVQFANQRKIGSIADLEEFEYAPTRRQRNLIEKSTTRHGDFARGWASVFVSDKFGEATTHWKKLETRVARGVGNPCPLVLIGIPQNVIRI